MPVKPLTRTFSPSPSPGVKNSVSRGSVLSSLETKVNILKAEGSREFRTAEKPAEVTGCPQSSMSRVS